jgi:hypothetical protein
MKDLIQEIARHMVQHPEEVSISEVVGEKTLIYELRCNASDVGKVIGKSGRTIAAMRTLATTAASRDGKRALIEVVQ